MAAISRGCKPRIHMNGRVKIFAVQYCRQVYIHMHCRPACIVGSTQLSPRGWEGGSLAILARCKMIKTVRYILLRKYIFFYFRYLQ